MYKIPNYKTKYCRTKLGSIAYLDEGKGVPIILFSCWSGGKSNFLPLISLLKGKFRVIAFDYPGWVGESFTPKKVTNVNFHIKSIEYFIDKLELGQKPIYIGYSYGTIIVNLLSRKKKYEPLGSVLLSPYADYTSNVVSRRTTEKFILQLFDYLPVYIKSKLVFYKFKIEISKFPKKYWQFGQHLLSLSPKSRKKRINILSTIKELRDTSFVTVNSTPYRKIVILGKYENPEVYKIISNASKKSKNTKLVVVNSDHNHLVFLPHENAKIISKYINSLLLVKVR